MSTAEVVAFYRQARLSTACGKDAQRFLRQVLGLLATMWKTRPPETLTSGASERRFSFRHIRQPIIIIIFISKLKLLYDYNENRCRRGKWRPGGNGGCRCPAARRGAARRAEKASAVFFASLCGRKQFCPQRKIFFSADVFPAAPQCFFGNAGRRWHKEKAAVLHRAAASTITNYIFTLHDAVVCYSGARPAAPALLERSSSCCFRCRMAVRRQLSCRSLK